MTPSDDQQLAQELVSNAKEQAEHIMLVDLERNDLGRVCEWGSVNVDELLTIERYSHVMHLVSNIKGSLKSDCNALNLIRAMFPGGTITGCLKVCCIRKAHPNHPITPLSPDATREPPSHPNPYKDAVLLQPVLGLTPYHSITYKAIAT